MIENKCVMSFRYQISPVLPTVIAFRSFLNHFYFCSLKVRIILSDLSAAAAAAGIIAHIYTWELVQCGTTTVFFCTNKTKILMIVNDCICRLGYCCFPWLKNIAFILMNPDKTAIRCIQGCFARILCVSEVCRHFTEVLSLMWIHIRNIYTIFSQKFFVITDKFVFFLSSWQ